MVTLDQLKAWAGQGESETQEFKQSTGQQLGLVELRGRGRGARWVLKGHD